MCSICGGSAWDDISEYIWDHSRDRGRDAHGKKCLSRNGSWVGNHRATPTMEVQEPIERQPVGDGPWFVFNGTLANDDELGVRSGEADTSVLPRVLSTLDLFSFADSINSLRGSFAIAALKPDGVIYLACNYKPIWVAHEGGDFYFSSLESHFPSSVRPKKMRPYSVFSPMSSFDYIHIPRVQYSSAIVIASSGLDSTSVAAYACHVHGSKNVLLLHFDYGCLAGGREKSQIQRIASCLGCGYIVLPIAEMFFGRNNPLMGSEKEIKSGKIGIEYAHEWVPARNLVMLSLTVAYAEANNFGHIYLGTNLEEAGAYPDNEEQFILDFNALLYGAVQNGIKIEIHSPLGGLMKHEIVLFGLQYNAPLHLTWSCYRGGEQHCGKCGPCLMRKIAFERNRVKDPIKYEE